MASYPPPPPDPQRLTPDQFRAAAASYRAFARARRAASRAEQSAARAQQTLYRNQMRMQSRSLRRGSLVGPILIIAAGVLLLLVCLGRLPSTSVLDGYSRWWPAILIVAGLVRLAEWFVDQRALTDGRPLATRGVGGGVIFLLIIAAVFGAALPSGANAHALLAQHLESSGLNLEEFLGDKHTSEDERDLTLPADGRLILNNPNGDITLAGHPSTDGMIHLTLSKTVYGWSSGEADASAARLQPHIDSSASTLSIDLPASNGSRTDVTLSLPESTPTTLTAGHGDVNVADMKSSVTLTSQHGDVELARLGGSVSVHVNNSGTTVSAHDLAGDLALKGHAHDLNLADVTGEVLLEGEFFGDTHMEHLHGPVSFNTSRTRFHTGRLDGELDISPGSSMTADHLSGATTLITHSRNIEFTATSGDVSIINRDGTVDLTSADPLGNISVMNRSGAVTLNLPKSPNIALSAGTQDGNIENNLELTPQKSGDNSLLTAQLGDARNKIDIRTTHADIEIHTGQVTKSNDDN